MTRKKLVYAAISLFVSAVLIAYLFTKTSFSDLTRMLAGIYLPALGAFLGISLVAVGLRAWRAKMLLAPQPIGWKDIVLVTLIRNCLDDLLPARIGALSYIYVLNQRLGFPFETAASTFAVGIVYDFLTLGPFLIIAVIVAGAGVSGIPSFALFAVAAGYLAATALVLWKIVPLARFLLRVFVAALEAFKADHKKGATASIEKLQKTITGLQDIRARKIDAPLFVQSFLIRFCKYAAIFFLLWALLKNRGVGLSQLGFLKMILGVTAAEMTAFLPIRGLAGFGTWESAWALAFGLMALPLELAVVSGLGLHLLTNLWEYGLGLLAILVLEIPLLRARRARLRNPGDAGNR